MTFTSRNGFLHSVMDRRSQNPMAHGPSLLVAIIGIQSQVGYTWQNNFIPRNAYILTPEEPGPKP